MPQISPPSFICPGRAPIGGFCPCGTTCGMLGQPTWLLVVTSSPPTRESTGNGVLQKPLHLVHFYYRVVCFFGAILFHLERCASVMVLCNEEWPLPGATHGVSFKAIVAQPHLIRSPASRYLYGKCLCIYTRCQDRTVYRVITFPEALSNGNGISRAASLIFVRCRGRGKIDARFTGSAGCAIDDATAVGGSIKEECI